MKIVGRIQMQESLRQSDRVVKRGLTARAALMNKRRWLPVIRLLKLLMENSLDAFGCTN